MRLFENKEGRKYIYVFMQNSYLAKFGYKEE